MDPLEGTREVRFAAAWVPVACRAAYDIEDNVVLEFLFADEDIHSYAVSRDTAEQLIEQVRGLLIKYAGGSPDAFGGTGSQERQN